MQLRHVVMAVLCLGVIGYSLWFALFKFDGWGAAGPVQVFLDAELQVRSEGTAYTFTVGEPGAVMLLVDMPADCRKDGSVSISPLFAAERPGLVYEPSREPEHVIAVPQNGLPSTRVELARAGPYVVRLAPIPMAMGREGPPPRVRIRILRAH